MGFLSPLTPAISNQPIDWQERLTNAIPDETALQTLLAEHCHCERPLKSHHEPKRYQRLRILVTSLWQGHNLKEAVKAAGYSSEAYARAMVHNVVHRARIARQGT